MGGCSAFVPRPSSECQAHPAVVANSCPNLRRPEVIILLFKGFRNLNINPLYDIVRSYLGKDFIQWLKNELDETSLGRAVRRFFRKLSGLAVEVNIAPETTG